MATLTESGSVVSPDTGRGMCNRELSSNSLLGLIGLEGEDSEDVSTAASNNITNTTYASPVMEENQQGGGGGEEINVELSPSTRNSQQDLDDITLMTTPPGSIQGPGILSLSPPLLTTYSSSTNGRENYISPQPHQQSRQSMYQHHSTQEESPQLSLPTTPTAQLPRSRPPRGPQLPSSEVGGNNSGHIVFPRPITSIGLESGSGPGPGGGHTRTPTDATNYSFLSSLTDMDASNGGGGGGRVDCTLPRRRTLSWDNNVGIGAGAAAGTAPVGSNSLGGISLPGSILQPILRKEEETECTVRPPMSIWASNLRKVSPPPARTSPRRALVPPSLPSREHLHPFLGNLQQNSSSPPNLTIACSSSIHTATTTATRSPFAYAQDEKKDDDMFRSPLQPLFERDASNASHLSPSDFTSYSPSPSTTIRLRKRTTANFRSSPNIVTQMNATQRSNKINIDHNHNHNHNHNNIGYTAAGKLDLKEILMSNKESVEETEIVKGVERDLFSDESGVISDDVQVYSISEVWPYLILVWGIFNLDHQRGSYVKWFVEVINPLFCRKFPYFCLGLGAITIIKRVLFKQLLKERIAERYRDELSILKKQLELLNEIASLSMKKIDDSLADNLLNGDTVGNTGTKKKSELTEEKKDRELHEEDHSDEGINRILCFQNAVEHIDNFVEHDFSSSFGKFVTTRKDFIDSSQIIFGRLVSVTRKYQEEIDFELLCQVAKLSDGSTDESNVVMLKELFCPSRQGQVSKFDFVTSIDKICKTMRLLIANIDNSSRIDRAFQNIVNVIFYTIIAIFVPTSIFGADIYTLLVALVAVLVNFTVIVCFTCAEYPKGILRMLTQKPYDIGDRVCFINTGNSELKLNNGPLLGGLIIEKYDLYTTTVRQGITGERSTFANGSILLDNTRVVNWKRSQRANVLFLLKFPVHIRREQIQIFRKLIMGWIKDHPREWFNLDVFRAVNVDSELKCVEYNVVLRHKESWHNYSVVEQSKSDTLIFLLELQNKIQNELPVRVG